MEYQCISIELHGAGFLPTPTLEWWYGGLILWRTLEATWRPSGPGWLPGAKGGLWTQRGILIPQVHIPTANFFFCLLAVPIDGNLGAGRRPFPFMVGLSPCSTRWELGRWAWVMPYFFFAFLPVPLDRKLGAGRGLCPFLFVSCGVSGFTSDGLVIDRSLCFSDLPSVESSISRPIRKWLFSSCNYGWKHCSCELVVHAYVPTFI